MSMFETDPASGDLVRSGGKFRRIQGANEIAQWVRTRARLFRGECFLRTDLGVLYIGGILEKGFSTAEIVGEYRSITIETPGIVSVGDVQIDQTDEQRANRDASLSYTAQYSLADLSERGPLQDTFTVTGI